MNWERRKSEAGKGTIFSFSLCKAVQLAFGAARVVKAANAELEDGRAVVSHICLER